MEPEAAEEVEETEDGPEGSDDGEIESYPWRRAVRAAPADSEDLCPACGHPLRHHAFRICTATNAFAKAHGRDWRYECDSWLFVGAGDGGMGDQKDGRCACEAHGIEGGAEWPAEYRPLYKLAWVKEPDPDDCEDVVVMDIAEWGPYEPPQTSLDAWT